MVRRLLITLAMIPLVMNHQLTRVESEFREMPGLQLTAAQARRLFNLDHGSCVLILGILIRRGFLAQTSNGQYIRVQSY